MKVSTVEIKIFGVNMKNLFSLTKNKNIFFINKNTRALLALKYFDFLLTLIILIICPFFFILTVFCCGRYKFTLNG